MADEPMETSDLAGEASPGRGGLLDELGASTVVDLIGVIGPLGAGGGQSKGETLWTMTCRLACWREDGAVRRSGLVIRQLLDHEALKKAMETLKAYRVVSLRVRLAEENSTGSPQALLLEILELDSPDAGMRYEAEERQKPVTRLDDFFGELVLDRRFDDWNATKDWRGKPVGLSLSMSDCQDPEAFLRLARELWESQDRWHTRITEFAVAKLLPLKNGAWLDDDEEELTPKEFVDRMELTSIGLNPDGSFDFWHNDGDLFWGHCIQIRGSIAEGPTHADIPG